MVQARRPFRHLTRTVRPNCAQQGNNIRCNSIHPGWFMTDLVRNSRTPAELEAQAHAIPMRRFGDIQDVANARFILPARMRVISPAPSSS